LVERAFLLDELMRRRPQRLKPGFKDSFYRSGEPLRHPKAMTKSPARDDTE
jgi:hypothetical protein